MKRDATIPLLALAANGEPVGVPSHDGFFWCAHCEHVVELTQREVEAAESAPAGSLVQLKCPRCKHHAVRWRFPSRSKPRPVPAVSLERGRELFSRIYSELSAQ